ncbi:glycoside hydrolase family 23 protein [Hebeloma cylindrosporum]|uniref:Glycoside hydrolase family 23 protein n=1 Tax=Hebeloma cylindrosporum TaxID=76867 RepID=A0A0C3C8U0_HEBCY|nr:glycoside hydrolase family 23 protein [Hebeloma cylindrosporum h7]
MRFITPSLALFLSIIVVGASLPNGNLDISARHSRLAHRATSLEARAPEKRCANRVNKKANNTNTPNNLVADKATTSSKPASKKPAPTKAAAPPPPPKQVSTSGLIKVNSGCGPSRATREITRVSGPNGHIDWLNCGFETAGGWQPPFVRVQDVVTQSLSSALQSPSSPFKACSRYIGIFEKYGNQFGIPPIILASFAMQESGCNPETVGGGGEQGLMQITREKCGGAPGGNCREPDFNIRTATKFFANTLANNGGNVLLSVGAYNGWHKGLTRSKAFAAATSSCCRCQNNGDYLHQFFNGWCQNINSYDQRLRLGKYFNLDRCG